MNPSTKILLINNDKDLGEALAFQLTLSEKYQIIETNDETSASPRSLSLFISSIFVEGFT